MRLGPSEARPGQAKPTFGIGIGVGDKVRGPNESESHDGQPHTSGDKVHFLFSASTSSSRSVPFLRATCLSGLVVGSLSSLPLPL